MNTMAVTLDERKIEESAKKIMDDFLAKIDTVPGLEEVSIVRDKSVRDDLKTGCDEEFWNRALKNAPSVSGTSLKMEKKKFDTE